MLYTITAINGNEVTLDKQPPSKPIQGVYRSIRYNVLHGYLLSPDYNNMIFVAPNDQISIGDTIEIKPQDEESIDKALRYNEGKLRWSLVDWESMEPMVQVLEFGAKKYEEENWKKPMDKKQILNSAMRHLIAMMNGEENDPESGLPHAGHVHCNMMFYSFHSKSHDSK